MSPADNMPIPNIPSPAAENGGALQAFIVGVVAIISVTAAFAVTLSGGA